MTSKNTNNVHNRRMLTGLDDGLYTPVRSDRVKELLNRAALH